MNIQKLTKILTDSGIEPNEAKYEIKMLLEHFCNYSELDRLKGLEPSEQYTKLMEEKVLYRAETGIPIQYIIGKAWFMGDYYKVTPDVLIPRDETEILASKAISLINEKELNTVLDIGTGSGCIACAIAKKTSATVLGTDISSDALRVALDNVTGLGINNRAIFRKSDLFEKIRSNEKFDLIVSNPPYIPHGTILQEELKYEPQIALFADDNGLVFYKRIIEKAPEYLNSGGYLMFELGILESLPVKNLMESQFERIEIIQDMAGIDRVIVGRLKSNKY
jgi:release factor glutamine methyltransferase